MIHDTFAAGLNPAWHITQTGNATVATVDSTLHLTVNPTPATTYSNAQIADYDLIQRDFSITPPVRLRVRAYTPTPVDALKGTGGFGFWNHAFAPNERGVRLPQALWFFFASPESNMALAQGVAGNGWKAATFNAQRWQFYGLLPAAPIGMLLMNWQPAYDALWKIGQKAIGVNESPIPLATLATPHTYTLDWLPDRARFYLDDDLILVARDGLPDSALGLVAWLDNQFAVVTPRGNFNFGIVPVIETQSLHIDEITIERL